MNAKKQPETESFDAAELGAMMREMRENLGHELDSVARDLRIRLVYLEAIESGRLTDLPGNAYVSGFLRSYSDFLGLEGDEIVRRFKMAGAEISNQPQLHLPSPVEEGRLPTASILVVAAVIAAAAYGGWYYLSGSGSDPMETVASLPKELSGLVDNAKNQTAPTTIAESPAAPAATSAGGDSGSAATSAATAETAAASVATPETTPAEQPAETAPENTVTSIQPESAPSSAEAPATAPDNATEVTPAASATSAPETTSETASDTAPAAATPAPSPSPVVASTPAVEESAPAPTVVETPAVAAVVPETSSAPAVPAETAVVPVPEAAPAAPAPTAAPVAPAAPAVDPVVSSTSVTTPSARSDSAPSVTNNPVTTETASRGTSPSASDSASGSESSPESAAAGVRIVVRATADSYVAVRTSDNQPLFSQLMRSGDSYEVPSGADLTLETGNAGGLQITVGGRRAPALGPVGEIRRNIPLDADKLLSGIN